MPGAQHLSQKVLAMKTAKYGDDITLNKPLLVLYALSQYKKGHGCLFDYASEVKPNLRELLKRYGPERNAYATDMPFWRLRHDGFWQLKNTELCSSQGTREPKKSELKAFQVAGGFDDASFAFLRQHSSFIDTLAFDVARAFIPAQHQQALMKELGFSAHKMPEPSSKITIIQRDIALLEKDVSLDATTRQRLINARLGQGQFRSGCLNLYPACPVTHFAFQPLLRASHIKPWTDCATSTERLDPFNGIMLAAHIDVLFDGGWISFADQGDVIVSNRLDYETYKALNLPGRISPFPERSLEYLEWHRSVVFED